MKSKSLLRRHARKHPGLGKMAIRISCYSLGMLSILSSFTNPFVATAVFCLLLTVTELVLDIGSPACRRRFAWYYMSVAGLFVSGCTLLHQAHALIK